MIKKHDPSLQSLRGLAALTVMLHHASYLYQFDHTYRVLIDAVLNPHAAIVLFFVLSGFVLAASLMRTDQSIPAVAQFYLKRVVRIAPALWVATALCVGYILEFNQDQLVGISDWGTKMMAAPSWTPKIVLLSLFGFPYILRPAYTILIEVIGSIAIPPMLKVAQISRILQIAMLIVLAAFYVLAYRLGGTFVYPMFLVHFAFGVVAAAIITDNLRLPFGPALFFISLLGLIFSRAFVMVLFTGALQPIEFDYHFPASALLEGAFATTLILSVVSVAKERSTLRNSLVVWIGDISYGIYLLHLPSLYLAAHIMEMSGIENVAAKFFITVLLALPITLLGAQLLFIWVEKPFIELGKKLTSRQRVTQGKTAPV